MLNRIKIYDLSSYRFRWLSRRQNGSELSSENKTTREREREKKNQAAATTHHDSGVAKSRASIKLKRM